MASKTSKTTTTKTKIINELASVNIMLMMTAQEFHMSEQPNYMELSDRLSMIGDQLHEISETSIDYGVQSVLCLRSIKPKKEIEPEQEV